MINLYYHGGSANHGCEAIVRSTKKIIQQKTILHTTDIVTDKLYGLDEIVTLNSDLYKPPKEKTIRRFLSAIHHKLTNTDYLFVKFSHSEFFNRVRQNDIYLSIGGDNYCYQGKDILGYYNRIIHEKGGKTVLWGCSFEPDDMSEQIVNDISLYDLIIARESISYNVLKKVNKNTVLIPDPAFLLDKVEVPLPQSFSLGNTVGLNVSPLVMNCETNSGITENNYIKLIDYIIKNTNMQVALIPHVVELGNDDRIPLRKLYDIFCNSKRVVMIDDCNAMELKGYISRCRFFVGARTHATIAAYSSCVPTLVVGYSVKAKGIATDIFGTANNYVLPVQSLCQEDDLTYAFEWLINHEEKIQYHLKDVIPEYCDGVWKAGDLIRGM